jgi:hypothetical protein
MKTKLTLLIVLTMLVAGSEARARVLVATNSTWRYFKGTSEASTPTNAWRGLDFDDSAWLTGAAPFHYGTNATGGDDNLTGGTILSDMRTNYTCVFLRQEFVIDDTNILRGLQLSLWVDDGLVVWINGHPVAVQFPVAAGNVAYNGRALIGRVATARSLPIDEILPYLRTGTNDLCLQAFNVDLANEDFRIDAELRSAVSVIAFGSAALDVGENMNELAVQLVRSGLLDAESTVEWFTTDSVATAGQDYVAGSGEIRFAPGESVKTVSVTILNDGVKEGAEEFTVSLRNPGSNDVIRAPATLAVNIPANDFGIQFDAAVYDVAENAGVVNVTVRRDDDLPRPVWVEWQTFNAGALADEDYLAGGGWLTLATGASQQRLSIPILNDGRPEGSENFVVRLRNPSDGAWLGATSNTIVRILDTDRGVHFDAASQLVAEADGVATLALRREDDLPVAGTVEWFTSDGTALAGRDYIGHTGQVTFAVGEVLKPEQCRRNHE